MPSAYVQSYESLTAQYARGGVRPGARPRTAPEHGWRRSISARGRSLRDAAAAAVGSAGEYRLRADARSLLLVLVDQMVLEPVADGGEPGVLDGVLGRLAADVRLILSRARPGGPPAEPLSGHAVVDGVLAAWDDTHLASVRVWGAARSGGPHFDRVYDRLTRRYVEFGPAAGELAPWRGAARDLRGFRQSCLRAVTEAEAQAGVTLRPDARHLSVVAVNQLILLPVYLAGRRAAAELILRGLARDLATVYRSAAGPAGAGEPVSGHAVLAGVAASWAGLGFAALGVWG